MNLAMITKVGKTLEKLTSDNAPTILTAVGVIGTAGTAYLTGKATVQAVKRIDEKKFIKHLHEPAVTRMQKNELSKTETLKLVWSCYIPPAVTGVTTIGAIVLANRISAKRMAALAAGYGLLDSRFDEYKTKMQEKLGVKKENDARDEIVQERTDKNPPDATIIINEGKAMFKDEPSGRYFESTMEDIRRAENDINHKILRDEYAVLTDWYELIGLAPTSLSEEFGWEISNERVEISKRAVITQDGKPCICLDYNVHPIRNGYSSGKVCAG